MAGYEDVKSAMKAGTPLEVICGTCRWDRLCVSPPELTEKQVDERIEQMTAVAMREGGPHAAQNARLLGIATLGDRSQVGAMCPVLAARLQSPQGRQIADQFRTVMRGLSTED